MVAARVGTSKGERSFPPPVRLPPSRLGASMSVAPFASLRAAAADERPVLVVLAGPNGAGKSTFFAQHLHGLGLLFVNADHIARLLRDAEPGLPRLQLERRAFDEAERLRADLIDLRFGFCTETVFSDPAGAKLDFMERARSAGFVVLLLFIGLAGPALSVARVATRVARGGHDVPDHKLFARYPRTLSNLRAAVGSVARARCSTSAAAISRGGSSYGEATVTITPGSTRDQRAADDACCSLIGTMTPSRPPSNAASTTAARQRSGSSTGRALLNGGKTPAQRIAKASASSASRSMHAWMRGTIRRLATSTSPSSRRCVISASSSPGAGASASISLRVSPSSAPACTMRTPSSSVAISPTMSSRGVCPMVIAPTVFTPAAPRAAAPAVPRASTGRSRASARALRPG